jgi:uncharacterized membrane protein
MDRADRAERVEKSNSLAVLLALLGVLVIFILIVFIGGMINPDLKLDQTGPLRFVFVGISLLIVYGTYLTTRSSGIWEVGSREMAYMVTGAALYAIISYLFNGSVFLVPSVSQVSLRPAIAIPIFFGYAFGPVVGFFTGAVGNMLGDALTGFVLSPQWSIGNGLVGLIAGMVWLFRDKNHSTDTILFISAVLTLLATAVFFINRSVPNLLYFNPEEKIYGDQPITFFAGISVVVGFLLVLGARFLFGSNGDAAAAVTWGMLGNLIGLGFAALSDIWINGFAPGVAIVGEYLPSAGPNLIFSAILVPVLVIAYSTVQRQPGG